MGLDMAALPGGQEEARAGVGVPVAVLERHVPQLVEAHQLAQLGDVMALAVHLHHIFLRIRVLIGEDELAVGELLGMLADVGEQGVPIHAVDGKGQGVGLDILPAYAVHLAPGLGGHISLAGAVDDDFAPDLIPAVGVFHRDAGDGAAVLGHAHHQGVQKQLHALLVHHLKHEHGPPLGVHIGEGEAGLFAVGVALVGQGVAGLEQALVGLLHDAAHVPLPLGVEQPGIGEARGAGQAHLPAHGAGALHQQGLCAGPGGADGRGGARCARAADNYVINRIICHGKNLQK